MTTRTFYVMDGEDELAYSVTRLDDSRFSVVKPDGATVEIDAFRPDAGTLNMLVEGASKDADVRERGGAFAVSLRRNTHHIEVLNEREKRMAVAGVGARGGGGPELTSPMAGKVVAVEVAEGDVVEAGQTVVIVEAMKMENTLKAHKDGTISRIAVESGQAVEIGDILVEIDD
jgi:biotin carboxyl carrier protein